MDEDQSYAGTTLGRDGGGRNGDPVSDLGAKWDCKNDELFFSLTAVMD